MRVCDMKIGIPYKLRSGCWHSDSSGWIRPWQYANIGYKNREHVNVGFQVAL